MPRRIVQEKVGFSFLGQEQISGNYVGLEVLFDGDRKSRVCDTAYSFWQPEEGKCQTMPVRSHGLPASLSTLSYSIPILLPNFPAPCSPFPKRSKNPASVEMRGFYSNWAAAVARCDSMGESPSGKAYGGLDHYQTMTACLVTPW